MAEPSAFPVWNQSKISLKCGNKTIQLHQTNLSECRIENGRGANKGVPPPPPPVNEFVWASGAVIVKLLYALRHMVAGKKILELGSGTGIGGIAAAMCGAEEVVLTDLPQALPSCESNVKLNKSALGEEGVRRIHVTTLDWSWKTFPELFRNKCASSNISLKGGKKAGDGKEGTNFTTRVYPDVIITADCIYSRELWTLLRRVLSVYSGPDTTTLMVEGIRGSITTDWFKMIRVDYSVVPAISLVPLSVATSGLSKTASNGIRTHGSRKSHEDTKYLQDIIKKYNTQAFVLKQHQRNDENEGKRAEQSDRGPPAARDKQCHKNLQH